MSPTRPGVAVSGPPSGIADDRDGASRLRLARARSGICAPALRTRRIARSFVASNATTSARNNAFECGSCTCVSCSPATTCAAVATSRGEMNQPLPSTPRPHAVPSTRTTESCARRTSDRRDRGRGRLERRRRPRDRLDRVDAREQVQQPARRHVGVEVLEDLRALRLAPERRLSREQQRRRAEHPDEHEPRRRAEEDAARRVEEAERCQLQPAAEERAGERRERVEQRRTGERADEAHERRPARARPAAQQVRREPRPRVGPGDEPAEREGAPDEPAPPAAERREEDDRERDPVHGRHAASVAAPSARAPGYNAASTGA